MLQVAKSASRRAEGRKRRLTYSFGNSPSANVHNSEVFPQAPEERNTAQVSHAGTGGRVGARRAVADNDEFSADLPCKRESAAERGRGRGVRHD